MTKRLGQRDFTSERRLGMTRPAAPEVSDDPPDVDQVEVLTAQGRWVGQKQWVVLEHSDMPPFTEGRCRNSAMVWVVECEDSLGLYFDWQAICVCGEAVRPVCVLEEEPDPEDWPNSVRIVKP